MAGRDHCVGLFWCVGRVFTIQVEVKCSQTAVETRSQKVCLEISLPSPPWIAVSLFYKTRTYISQSQGLSHFTHSHYTINDPKDTNNMNSIVYL